MISCNRQDSSSKALLVKKLHLNYKKSTFLNGFQKFRGHLILSNCPCSQVDNFVVAFVDLCKKVSDPCVNPLVQNLTQNIRLRDGPIDI